MIRERVVWKKHLNNYIAAQNEDTLSLTPRGKWWAVFELGI